ncbi:DNA/RNA non-specific endonuclease [Arthrobacter sp. TMS2-4]
MATANEDTFHHTNAAPQAAKFNQGLELWLDLETYLLENAADHGRRHLRRLALIPALVVGSQARTGGSHRSCLSSVSIVHIYVPISRCPSKTGVPGGRGSSRPVRIRLPISSNPAPRNAVGRVLMSCPSVGHRAPVRRSTGVRRFPGARGSGGGSAGAR